MNDLGEGLMMPILQKDNLLYCQLSDGKYAICQRYAGVVEQFDKEPSEEFVNQLKNMGFINVV